MIFLVVRQNLIIRSILMVVCLFLGSTNSFACYYSPYYQILPSTPTSRFELIDDEARDLQTGLTWQRCAVGQNWDGTTCSGSPTLYRWSRALTKANSDWRLPNIKELSSIIEVACPSHALNSFIFPNSVFDSWSSTPYAFPWLGDQAWYVKFSDFGQVDFGLRNDVAVRLVRDEL